MDLATLGIQVNSGSANAASASLNKLTISAIAAQKATDGLALSNKGATASMDAATVGSIALQKAMANGGAVTSAQIQAVGGWAAAQKIMQQSSLQTAEVQKGVNASVIEGNEAVAASAVESAGVQIAANEKVVVNTLGMRESLVLVREGMRGQYTRMAGSASLLLQSFGLLEIAIGTLIPPIGAFLAVLELSNEQINYGAKGTGDLTKGLGLTAEQLAKVKDRTVTFGDTFEATFEVLGTDILGLFGGNGKVWGAVEDALNSATADLKLMAAFWIGVFVGTFDGVVAIWNKLPSALGDAFVSAENIALSSMQGMINGAISGLNVVLDWIRDHSAAGSVGASITDIAPVDLGQVKNQYANAGADAASAFSTAFGKGMTATSAALDKFYSDVSAQARANAIANIRKEAGKPKSVSDSQGDQAAKQLAEAQNELKTQTALNGSLESGSVTLAEYNKNLTVSSELKRIIGQRDADLAKGDAKSIADANKLTPIIAQLTVVYGKLFDQKLLGKDMVSILNQIEGPLDSYVRNLQAINALRANGMSPLEAAVAESNLALNKSVLSEQTALGATNPFGATGQMGLDAAKQTATNAANDNLLTVENAKGAAKSDLATGNIDPAAYAKEMQKYADMEVAITQDKNNKMLEADQQYYDKKLALGQTTFDGLATALGDMFGKQSAAYKAAFVVEKAFQIARATLALETAVAEAMAAPPPLSWEQVAAVVTAGAQVISAIASVNAPGLATGVVGLNGPGTATSDSIMSWLSRGESVITAAGTAGNQRTLSAMNSGAKFDAPPPANSNAPITVMQPIHLHLDGAVVTSDLLKQVNTLAQGQANKAYEHAMKDSKKQSRGWVADANSSPRKRTA